MKEIKKKKSKPDPKILIPEIVGAVCVLMIAVVVIFMNPESTTAGQLQKKHVFVVFFLFFCVFV